MSHASSNTLPLYTLLPSYLHNWLKWFLPHMFLLFYKQTTQHPQHALFQQKNRHRINSRESCVHRSSSTVSMWSRITSPWSQINFATVYRQWCRHYRRGVFVRIRSAQNWNIFQEICECYTTSPLVMISITVMNPI